MDTFDVGRSVRDVMASISERKRPLARLFYGAASSLGVRKPDTAPTVAYVTGLQRMVCAAALSSAAIHTITIPLQEPDM